ncbi:phosphopantetheine-binding protein [Amycolatopsis anabasis]|uniref:phosphopantetheine-binding protein n=1 Tax=Amycolatopsis anabasis TaxID=1840409 RepID=UPI00131E1424|nr:phosphopantetheine-binding protein [Amycolatopsis anabasis]
MSAELTRDRVLAEVADLLDVEVDELDFDEDLVDAGLDSIRIMSLVERWRTAGAGIGFVDLAETPTLTAWLRTLRL